MIRRGPRARTVAALVSLAAAVALTACSGGDDEAATSTTAPSVVPAERAASSGPGVDESAVDEGADEDEDEVADPAGRPPAGPGTVVWVHELEPPDLHPHDPANRLPITSWIDEGLLESLFGVSADLTYHPELLASEPEVSDRADGTVSIDYTLRSGLSWSDGEPLTAEDVAYTHRILTEGCQTEPDGSILDASLDGCRYIGGDRVGIDQVTSLEVTGDTTFTVTLSSFYPDWPSLFGPIFAAHAFGDDAGEVNRRLRTMTGPDGPLPSSGPLRFDSWDRGVSMTLVRNDAYHGSTSPDATTEGPATIEAVRIDFVTGLEARLQALEDGRADVVMERPRQDHQRLTGSDAFVVTSRPGADWEHLGMNLLDEQLALSGVREAVLAAIDKPALIEQVFTPLYGPILAEEGLGNSYWLPGQPPYVDHQGAAGDRSARAARALTDAGFERSGDGWRHPDLGPLRLTLSTTADDPIRRAQQELIAAQLEAVGFEIDLDDAGGAQFFLEGPFSAEAMAAAASRGAEGDADRWDLALFGWEGGPWPGGQSGAYRNGSPGNPYGFANPEFETAAFECDATVDDGERADCYNELDRYVTTLDQIDDGLFIVPLARKPSFYGYSTARLTAVPVAPDIDRGGPLVNAVDFRLIDEPSAGDDTDTGTGDDTADDTADDSDGESG